MKNRSSLLLGALLVVSLALAGCPGPPPETYSSAEISVDGMTCDMCVTKVEHALQAIDGMKEYAVDLKAKMASVTFEVAKVQLADIEHAIAEAGFKANETARDAHAYQSLPDCCRSSETVDM